LEDGDGKPRVSKNDIRHLLPGFFRLFYRSLGFKDSRAAEGDIVKLTKGGGFF
jgi:hypothetical protein